METRLVELLAEFFPDAEHIEVTGFEPIPGGMAAHRELGLALQATMIDLDELQRAGVTDVYAGLDIVREHMGPRIMRDVETILVGNALLGRG